jgi:glycosyltransferase involved in cell wall biosynthesis
VKEEGAEWTVRVSVLLPVRNGEPFLRQQLEALERQVCTFSWEVIVIDNGSSDVTPCTAEEFKDRLPNFQLLSEPTPGKSRALNLGMGAARGSQFIFVDSDDEAQPDYVQKMSEALDQFDIVGAYNDTQTLNPWYAREEMATNDGIPFYRNFRQGLPGCILGMRAPLCRQVGLYDVTLMSAEDIDYTWRAAALGATFGRQLNAVMRVRRPASGRAAFNKSRSYGRSHIWLYQRYRSEGMPRRTLRGVLGALRASARSALRGETSWAWAMACEAGTLVGHAEESIRCRVFYP